MVPPHTVAKTHANPASEHTCIFVCVAFGEFLQKHVFGEGPDKGMPLQLGHEFVSLGQNEMLMTRTKERKNGGILYLLPFL